MPRITLSVPDKFVAVKAQMCYSKRVKTLVKRTGRKVQRGKLAVLGKYIDDALLLAGITRAELARRADVDPSTVTKVCLGTRQVARSTLLKWCNLMQCPDWLEERILNAAGYASPQQMQQVENEVEQSHQQILTVLQQKRNKQD